MKDSDLTNEEVFLAWRKAINRDRAKLRSLTDKLMYKARRADELEAKLVLVDEYGEFCAGGGGRHIKFVEWLDLREGK